jgi:hypothetical protein
MPMPVYCGRSTLHEGTHQNSARETKQEIVQDKYEGYKHKVSCMKHLTKSPNC